MPRYNPQMIIDSALRHKGRIMTVKKELGCAYNTIRRYMELYPEVKAAFESPAPEILPAFYEKTSALVESKTLDARRDSIAYTERDLQLLAANEITQIASMFNWPFVESVSVEHRLPNNKRIDILCKHFDGSLSIIEVKVSGKHAKPVYFLYSTIGQVLYYNEVLKDVYNLPQSKIRLGIISDFEPDEYFYRTLNSLKVPMQYCNVIDRIAVTHQV